MSSTIYYPGYSQVQVSQNLQVRQIEDISNNNPMIVTTSVEHGYSAGVLVTFRIPDRFGMKELDGITAQVMAVTPFQLLIGFNSLNLGIFKYPEFLGQAHSLPYVVPVSSGPPLPPDIPLPNGNQNSFEGVVYNDGVKDGN